jgi:hypothetical protein
MIKHLVAGLLVATLTAGCLPVIETGPQRGEGPVVDGMPYEEPVPEERADMCGASRVQHLVGGDWPQPLPAGMTVVRVIPYGLPATADHNPERVNVDLEPDGRRIRAIWCG